MTRFASACLLLVLAARLAAAPPTVTYLYPAGGQWGATTEVTAAGTFDTWPVKVWVSGKVVSVVAAKDKGKFAVTAAKDAVPGVYWLRAYNADGASPLRPFIVGTLPEVAEKEPNDEHKKPQAVDPAGVTVNGRLEKAGDVDCFGVALKKGQTLVASLEANRTLKSPMDAILHVVSADGIVVVENNDFHGLDPQLAFTAPRDGDYVVRVFAFPATPDSSIRFAGAETYVYRLTLTTGGFASHPMPLAVNNPKEASAVRLEGWNIARSKYDFQPDVVVWEPYETVVASGVANPVRVRLEPHPVFGPTVPEAARPPFSFSGQIEKAGGEVVVPFDGKKGQALSIQVESRTLGLAVNPVIRVLDADGKQITRTEPTKLNGDTAVSFTPAADGRYSVAVADLFGGGGFRFAFLLRVVPPAPDYDLSAAADRFALVPGTPLDIPLKIARRGGLTKPIEVTVEGLPEGVTFAVKPAGGAKPDPAAVTVTLTAGKAASGAFRIAGSVKDEPRLTRYARAPLAEFETGTADLWLTAGTGATVATPPPKKKK